MKFKDLVKVRVLTVPEFTTFNNSSTITLAVPYIQTAYGKYVTDINYIALKS